MRLKDFVAETLKDVISGIKEAQGAVIEQGAMINPNMAVRNPGSEAIFYLYGDNDITYYAQNIEFEIAVASEKEDSAGGGVSVITGIFAAGGKGQIKDTNSMVNKIRFTVPVMFPLQEGAPKIRRSSGIVGTPNRKNPFA